MLSDLVVYNFDPGYQPEKIIALNEAATAPFVLKTCQRTLVVCFKEVTQLLTNEWADKLEGRAAYHYLLEIICGLKSHLVGENEIVGQFKSAYQEYIGVERRNNRLLAILEKLFKDAKEIRSTYLIGLCQKTYSSIARKYIIGRNEAKEVLILGSGNLAEDLINQFKKKAEVYITARNPEKLLELSQKHSVKPVEWKNSKKWIQFPFMANTIGFDGVLLDNAFFEQWSRLHSSRFFVDLGSPSAIKTTLGLEHGVMKLDDIFHEGAIHEGHKREQIAQAQKALTNIAEKRERVFSRKLMKQTQVRSAAYV